MNNKVTTNLKTHWYVYLFFTHIYVFRFLIRLILTTVALLIPLKMPLSVVGLTNYSVGFWVPKCEGPLVKIASVQFLLLAESAGFWNLNPTHSRKSHNGNQRRCWFPTQRKVAYHTSRTKVNTPSKIKFYGGSYAMIRSTIH